MQIQVNSDRNIEGDEVLAAAVRGTIEGAMSRFIEEVTRVEVHLSDENGPKGGRDDIRCLMEARLEGRQPIVVTHEAATLELAVDGASDKLSRKIDSILGRLRDPRR